jgi:hypothetical protein
VSGVLIVTLYVDDLIFTKNNERMIEEFKKKEMKNYEMSDLRLLNHLFTMDIYQEDERVFIC